MLNTCYPIGSIYWSNQNISPQSFIGGVWTRIYNCFLWACYDSVDPNDRYANVNPNKFDYEYGEYTHTLTKSEMPSHSHSINDSGHQHHSVREGSGDIAPWLRSSGITIDATANGYSFGDLGASNTYTSVDKANITLNDTGGNQSHENMPPYLRRYCWERTA